MKRVEEGIMIRGLDIANYGSYTDFIWPKDNDKFVFKKVNIIYGHNYSGKTTLSRIFNTLETRKPHRDYLDVSYELQFCDGTKLNSNKIEELNSDYTVRVFNTDFVKDNLGWLHNSDGSIQPFTVLGSDNNEIKSEIQKLDKMLKDDDTKTGLEYELPILEKNKNDKAREYAKLDGEISSSLTEFAAIIRGNQSLYAKNPYNKTHLEADIPSAGSVSVFSDMERSAMVKQLEERALSNITYSKFDFDVIIDIVQNATRELCRVITIPNEINELVVNDLIKKWLSEGIDIHEKDNHTCQFCGSLISPERWCQLKSCFNDQRKEFRENINKLITECTTIQQKVEKNFNYNKSDFYIVYQDEYLELFETWNKKKMDLGEQFELLITALKDKEAKETEVFTFVFDESIITELKRIDEKIETLVTSNNAKTTSLKNDKEVIQKKLLLSDIKSFLLKSNYDANQSKLKALHTEKKENEGRYNNKKKEIDETKIQIELKKAQEKDESKGAERVNQYLKIYFGSDEIQLVPVIRDGLTTYEIRRNDLKAKNLSDGECSLISFCYFISKIEDLFYTPNAGIEGDTSAEVKEPTNGKVIVYIDDPISSLDNSHVFFIFSMIEEKIARQSKLFQLFISTHNLDFLKYLKRLTGLDDEKAYFSVEKHKKGLSSKSQLAPMSHHLKEYVTEFNYLFQQMYDIHKPIKGDKTKRAENSYTNFYSLPNNIRKFLELYTFYRYPSNDTFMKRLEFMFDGHVPILINRITNEFSHLTYIERAWKPFEIPELEEIVNIIFAKMQEIDAKQYQVLMESCK